MARLKLQSVWEDEERYEMAGPDRSFLSDLVRASRKARHAVDSMDLIAAFEAAGGSPTLPPGGAASAPVTRPPTGGSHSARDNGRLRAQSARAAAARPRSAHLRPGGRSAAAAAAAAAAAGGIGRPASAPVPSVFTRMQHRPSSGRSSSSTASAPRKPLRTSANGVILEQRPDPACTGSLERATSPSVARIPSPSPRMREVVPEVPGWFRQDGGAATVRRELLPEYSLWVTLHGGNGTWKRKAARQTWSRLRDEHQAAQKEWHLRAEKERARALEAERRRRQEAEEEERAAREAEALRRQKREEAERRAREAELARRRREEEEERQRQLRLPRQCTGCEGSGKCQNCMGRGYVGTMYLSASVSRNKNETESVCGHLPRGCEVCGGWGDDGAWGEFHSGSGRCFTCSGVGSLKAPPGGWPF